MIAPLEVAKENSARSAPFPTETHFPIVAEDTVEEAVSGKKETASDHNPHPERVLSNKNPPMHPFKKDFLFIPTALYLLF